MESARTGIPLDARDVVNLIKTEERVELLVAQPLLREQLDEPSIAVAAECSQVCAYQLAHRANTNN